MFVCHIFSYFTTVICNMATNKWYVYNRFFTNSRFFAFPILIGTHIGMEASSWSWPNPLWLECHVPVDLNIDPSEVYMHQETIINLWFNHRSQEQIMCNRKHGHLCFELWLAACSGPSHYLNQGWVIVNWTFRNQLLWNSKRKTIISFSKMHLNISPA